MKYATKHATKHVTTMVLVVSLIATVTLIADGGKKQVNEGRKKVAAKKEFASVAAQQAMDRYLAEIEAIERVAAKRKELARQRLADALKQTHRAETEPGPRYHGMLGSYYDNHGRIPYIMLSVPNGENVLSTRQKSAMNARGGESAPMYQFAARGHLTIPAKGRYRLETGRGYGHVKLNGTSYILRREKVGQPLTAEVELDQGTYEVNYSVGNNGGQMNYAMLRVVDAERGKTLPIFVYESDLKKFWHDLTLGVELMETSGWTMKNHRME